MFQLQSSHYSVRSSKSVILYIPRTKRVTFQDRSLSVAGATLWNQLPPNVQNVNKLEDFKVKLKTHLFTKAFNL